jgi:2-haloacid dehalogenase
MPPKALTFDIIGTVFDWYGSFSAQAPIIAHRYGFCVDGHAFAGAAIEGYAAGLRDYAWPPDKMLRSSIARILESAGRVPSSNETDDFFNIWRSLQPWPDVPKALRSLQQQFSLAILSNMSVVTQSALISNSGLPFHYTISGETVGAYKPDPTMYQQAATQLNLQPGEIMMVAAHDFDLDAARACGFSTAFIKRPTEGNTSNTYDINANTFDELADALGVHSTFIDPRVRSSS